MTDEDPLNSSIIPFNVIFCDDIRKEVTGKEILIGVYSADLVVQSIPVVLGISLFIQLKVGGGAGTIRKRLRVVDPSGNRAGETVLEHSLLGLGREESTELPVAISMPPLAISIITPGYIRVYWENGDEFDLIGEKRVIIGPVTNAFVPPSTQSSPPNPVS